MTPGRKFSTTISASRTRRWMMAMASGFCRSRVRLRLLPFTDIQMGAILRSDHSRERAMLRVSSPSGCSILTTSAPWRASWNEAKGPARTRVKSRMRMLEKAWFIGRVP